MTITVDIDSNGNRHFIEISDTYPLVEHPDGVSGKVTVLQMLAYHNEHPEAREKGGWHVWNQLPGEIGPKTRWHRLVNAANDPQAHPDLRALGLTK